MARLSVVCLGPFQVTLGGQPVTAFKSNKVRALLAYLAVESDRPHPRPTLAGLLWPDWPDHEALSNLRYALSSLRGTIADRTARPPYLSISRDHLQLNPAGDVNVDATDFLAAVEMALPGARAGPDVPALEAAAIAYRGEFLEGFSLKDSAPFEEWILLRRQQIAQQHLVALRYLAAGYEDRGQYEKAQAFARRQTEIEPWDEKAHRQLMRLLALSGRRSAALAQYDLCRQMLADELGVEPDRETTRLYERIRGGDLSASRPARPPGPQRSVVLPASFETESPQVDLPVFVDREQELAQLEAQLARALAGQGRVAFVTGEAGSGKTALIQEFSRRAQARLVELAVAHGNCNAYTGVGDPYLPFREILSLLTGDIEARSAAGSMSKQQAGHLWQMLPVAAQALIEKGPDLIDTFISGRALLERVLSIGTGRPEWLAALDKHIERRALASPVSPNPQQYSVVEQYTAVTKTIALKWPLLLLVDDLQWADPGSISLLLHLGHQVSNGRILILGAYRPEEVAIGRDGERHPLEPVLNAFQRAYGDITLNLSRSEKRVFVDAFLDSEPNDLGADFRQMILQRTRGHPLFTTELLRGLQERGELVQDQTGRWVEGPTLDWDCLPARVEAVIAERIGRLPEWLQETLRVASVEGETFTAEVVAQVQATDERRLITSLSGELDRRHRLIRAQTIERLASGRVSRYRFRNYLFQWYLYDSLDEVERAYLHEDVGTALEALHQGTEGGIAVQLAWHFQEAGIVEKAIHYLRLAGEHALLLSAYQEGMAHLKKGLALIMDQPDPSAYAHEEVALQVAIAMAWQGLKSAGSQEVKEAFTRAHDLSQQLGETTRLCQVLGEMTEFYYVGMDYRASIKAAEESLALAEQVNDPLLVALGRWYLGFNYFNRGEFETARAYFKPVIAMYEPRTHHAPFVALRGKDPGIGSLGFDACCLWMLGFPDQAVKQGQKALAWARELDHPFTLAEALTYTGCLLHSFDRDAVALKQHAEELIPLGENKVRGWQGTGTSFLGAALVRLGRLPEGIEAMKQGLMAREMNNTTCLSTGTMVTLAEALGQAGRIEEAMNTLAETLALVERTEERYVEAEVHRLRGELLLAQGKEAEGETALSKAIEIAKRQQARLLELRASVSLARLQQKQGKGEEARQRLRDIYDWFSEGFETPDLQEARGLLEGEAR